MNVIAVVAFKGGTGKTTTSVNVSRGLAKFGPRGTSVLGLDLDRTNFDFYNYRDSMEGVEVRSTTSGRIKSYAAKCSHDYAVIDCPPSLAKEALSALKYARIAIVPLVPEMQVVRSLPRLLKVIQAVKQPAINPSLQVRFLLTMCDPRDQDSEEIAEELRTRFGPAIWENELPRAPIVNRANAAHSSILDFSPRCAVARGYESLSRFVLDSFPSEKENLS